jgi:hypothetical protein
MKIIDQTPFFNHETNGISLIDRGKAIVKYGSSWIKEVEAQNLVISVLDQMLDKNYTLLRNVSPLGLEASIPFILVGPAGVFVMYVTPLTGIYRAKGDQWGTISGNAFKNEKPNLLTRTEHMARAIQVFLQRQGYLELTIVEAILLCSDPSFHVDSIRPIIRVVLRDALERFAISILQARVVLSQESIRDVIERILNPPQPEAPQPVEDITTTNPEPLAPAKIEEPYIPAFAFPESLPISGNSELSPKPINKTQFRLRIPAFNKRQLVFLIGLFAVWLMIVIAFLVLVIQDQGPFLLSLLP